MPQLSPITTAVDQLTLPLERDGFMRNLIRELATVLEEVVGLEEASGFISVVGQRVGLQLEREYRAALGASQLTHEQVAAVLVDLKRRIQGDFFVIAQGHPGCRVIVYVKSTPEAEGRPGREYVGGDEGL